MNNMQVLKSFENKKKSFYTCKWNSEQISGSVKQEEESIGVIDVFITQKSGQ